MTVTEAGVKFSSGKEVYANNGIIGLSPDGHVFGGYDGEIDTMKLTPQERKELAQYMIEKWTEWGMKQ